MMFTLRYALWLTTVNLPCLKIIAIMAAMSNSNGHGRTRAVGEVKANAKRTAT